MKYEDPYIELVELLAQYDSLLEQLQASFIDGFQHLSRANYSNKDALRGRYGQDYWDYTYEGTQFVSTKNNKIDIINRVGSQVKDSSKVDEAEEVDDRKLRRRKVHTEEKEPERSKKPTNLTDPIYMFGGVLSVPFSLRQCQSCFKGSIPLLAGLVNCRKEIDLILKRLGD
ncbi:LAFE_0B10572g1_1 [Lachancea fermentati]|uniref:Vacuolar ATPase assembly protein VMA22 n=1 Tax=Lachancea fermentati TaxID=4955 RepID=A0A1G4M8M5_LACFM|nr:LAFE_0B10572g1_1 [Lachancea fermentati]